MAQNFNRHNGTPNANFDSTYGGLSDSLIFPALGLTPENFQSGWPTNSTWQMNNPDKFNTNGGNYFHGQTQGDNESSGFFSRQQNLPYDETEDFYDNGNESTYMGQNMKHVPASDTRQLQNSLGGSRTASKTILGAPKDSPQAGLAPIRVQSAEKTPSKANDPAPVDRAAELRARVLASRRNGGSSPAAESSQPKTNGSGRVPTPQAEPTPNGNSGANTAPTKSAETPPTKQPHATVPNGNASVMPRGSTIQPAIENIDIEGLFAQERAAMAEGKDSLKPKNVSDGNLSREIGSRNGGVTKTDTTNKPQNAAAAKSRRQSLDQSESRSETSEQGEIKEDAGRSTQTNRRGEPKSQDGDMEQSRSKIDERNESSNVVSIRQQPQSIDTALANEGKKGPSDESKKTQSPNSAKTPSTAKSFRDRDPLPSHPPRYDARRDRRTEMPQEASSRYEEAERERDRSGHPHGQDKRYGYSQSRSERSREFIDQNERAAAEYKSQLQNSKVEQSEVEPRPIEARSVEQSVVTTEGKVVDYNQDLDDWLDMTGYHDETYRKKALNRHRELIELDRRRADLEREAQIEHEERSHLSRAQSIRPKESIELAPSRSAISPGLIRTSSTLSMPPPPVPLKENAPEMGIKIKDTANQTPNLRRGENEPPHSSLKRQHVDEGYESSSVRPTEKAARIDNMDYSFNQESRPVHVKTVAPSLESRITVDDNEARSYQRRSLSPRYQPRSVSPAHHRPSATDGHARRPPPDGPYSPDHRSDYNRGSEYSYAGRGRYEDHRSGYDSSPRYDPYHSYGRAPIGSSSRYEYSGSSGYRGRGRGRGYYANTRGGNYSKTFKDMTAK
ncbi:hypothetical protein MMC20_006238 [Loxospora ochrophaea]|nr:hypothetical protein [Loxospora ochrophaea]